MELKQDQPQGCYWEPAVRGAQAGGPFVNEHRMHFYSDFPQQLNEFQLSGSPSSGKSCLNPFWGRMMLLPGYLHGSFPVESHAKILSSYPYWVPPLLRQGWLCGLCRITNIGKEEDLILWVCEKFIEAAPQQWGTYTRAGTWAALLDMELLLWAWLGKTRFLAGEIQIQAYTLLVTVLTTAYCCDSKHDSLSFSLVHSYLSSKKQAGTLTFSTRDDTHSPYREIINWHDMIWWE